MKNFCHSCDKQKEITKTLNDGTELCGKCAKEWDNFKVSNDTCPSCYEFKAQCICGGEI